MFENREEIGCSRVEPHADESPPFAADWLSVRSILHYCCRCARRLFFIHAERIFDPAIAKQPRGRGRRASRNAGLFTYITPSSV